MGWSKRYKVSSKMALKDAKMMDPAAYLSAMGFDVTREGRHLKADNGEKQVRVTLKDDGVWISCTKDESRIGDNLDLVWFLEGVELGFLGAIKRLKSFGENRIENLDTEVLPVDRVPPKMPNFGLEDVEKGREYLQCRGVDLEIIMEAERAGFLAYNKSGVLFVGRDKDGIPQNVTRWDIRPDEEVLPKGFRPKADLKGSSKFFPQILPGDPKDVWIVEGGVDALALQTWDKRDGRKIPTVLVSGGARNRSFLDNPDVQALLKKAEGITIAFENEKNKAIQEQTDEDHMRQGIKIKEIIGEKRKMDIKFYRPELGKDLADENLKLLQTQPDKNTPKLSIV